jgi:hypothetical protein
MFSIGTVVTVAGPRLSSETFAFDFGKVASTNTVEKVFVLNNAGNENLNITKVRVCCGATVTLATNTIGPGTNTTLTIKLSLAGRSGAMAKSIYLHSNDPTNQIQQIAIRGNVEGVGRVSQISAAVPRIVPAQADLDWKTFSEASANGGMTASNQPAVRYDALVIQPGTVRLGEISALASQNVTIAVCAAGAKRVSLLHAAVSSSNMESVVKELEPRRKYEISLLIKPPLPVGEMRETIELTIKDYNIRKMSIPVFADVKPDICSAPRELGIAVTDEKKITLSRIIKVKSLSKAGFKLLNVRSPVKAIKATVKAVEAGQEVLLSGEIDPAELEGKEVVIETDVEGCKEIRVPIRVKGKEEKPTDKHSQK